MLVNANETSWIGYRDPAASDPLPQVFVMDARVISVVASFVGRNCSPRTTN